MLDVLVEMAGILDSAGTDNAYLCLVPHGGLRVGRHFTWHLTAPGEGILRGRTQKLSVS